jgi:ketosteroid isomerase-like protein
MTNQAVSGVVAESMNRINQAWLAGRIDDMAPMIHPDVIMVVPGFAGRAQGRDPFLKGFREFYQSATIHEFGETERVVDVVGDTAVVSFLFAMVYERNGGRYRATGRDFWVFHREAAEWVAVWRTMFDLGETDA